MAHQLFTSPRCCQGTTQILFLWLCRQGALDTLWASTRVTVMVSRLNPCHCVGQQTPSLPVRATSGLRNPCTERLLEQGAPSLQVPAGSWGTQQGVPRHDYCQGTARQSLGLPCARCRVPDSRGWLAGLTGHSIFFPCRPSRPCCTRGCRRARSGPALSSPPARVP